MRVGLILLVALLMGTSLSAQERNLTSEFVIWNQFTQKVKFNGKYSGTFAGQYRAFTDRENGYHLFFTAGVTRKLKNGFSVSAGVSNLKINRFVDTDFVLVPEIRGFQSIQFSFPIDRSSFSWRLMTEQRFFRNAANGELVSGYFHNWRFRNKFSYSQYLSEKLSLIISSEVMVNAGKVIVDVLDQHRAQLLFGYDFGSFNIKTGYMHWFFQTSANDHENRHTWVISLTHSL